MDLKTYFEDRRGLGVLSTANEKGEVNSAIYARPHVLDDGSVAFIMGKHLSLENVESNGHAAFLFVEEGGKYLGRRLSMTVLKIETDPKVIDDFRRGRGKEIYERYKELDAKLVFFRVDHERPLIGN
jgi:hypothetical protein